MLHQSLNLMRNYIIITKSSNPHIFLLMNFVDDEKEKKEKKNKHVDFASYN